MTFYMYLLLLTYWISMLDLVRLTDGLPPPPSHSWHKTYPYSGQKTATKTFHRKIFLPKPQDCPDTGKTVCKEVGDYPTDKILKVITDAKASNFNFTSEFVDESLNDEEPKLEYFRSPTKSNYKGYIVYQSSYDQNYQPRHASFKQKPIKPPVHWETNFPYSSPWRPIINQDPFLINRSKRRSNFASERLRVLKKRQIIEKEEICETQSMFITPKAALNDQSEWKFIVNLGDKDSRFRQVIKVNICSQVDGACSAVISLPFGFSSRCRQKFIKKKLLALDPSGQSTSNENFFVPSCCVCEIIKQ
ncbi:uncharacterized protein LOC141856698 [Brevipalpus obovatus]|uniref:uncharacterized protein LOC141856698 n=1 Tax=Brevipalpus obovatus TaxID=246614 RepID=UPI003D9F5DD7